MPAKSQETGRSDSTRSSLLRRLRDWEDQTSWAEFFELYKNLIHGMARKAGLTETEAKDVMQETLVSVANRIRTFRYDRAKGSFKAWLKILTNWRIKDQYRRRMKEIVGAQPDSANIVDRAPEDQSLDTLVKACEREWVERMSKIAISHTRTKVSPRDFQIFDLAFLREWPAKKVAATLKVSCSQVYVSKHRVSSVFRRELARLHHSASLPV